MELTVSGITSLLEGNCNLYPLTIGCREVVSCLCYNMSLLLVRLVRGGAICDIINIVMYHSLHMSIGVLSIYCSRNKLSPETDGSRNLRESLALLLIRCLAEIVVSLI